MQDTKKVAGELLVELEKKGVTFETVDGKLKYKDSKGNFTENSKEKVKKYKEEIIEILKKKQTIDEFITDNDYETNVYPLTDVQAAYLVGKTEAVKWGGIGCKGYIEVDFGSYSAEELSRAWKVLVNRHEMLRAKVTEVGFEILERDEIDYEIKIVNLQKMAEREKVDTLSKITMKQKLPGSQKKRKLPLIKLLIVYFELNWQAYAATIGASQPSVFNFFRYAFILRSLLN